MTQGKTNLTVKYLTLSTCLLLIFTVYPDANSGAGSNERKIKQTKMTEANFHFSPYPSMGTGREQSYRTKFNSDDEIYGLLELPTSVGQYFEISPANESGYFLDYIVTIIKEGKQVGKPNSWTSMHLTEEDIKNTQLTFDVIPGGFNSSTRIFNSPTLHVGLTSAPLPSMLTNSPLQEGTYTIQIQISSTSTLCKALIDFSYHPKHQGLLTTRAIASDQRIKETVSRHVRADVRGLPYEWNLLSGVNDTGYNEQQLTAIVREKIGQDARIVKLIIQPTIFTRWIVETNDMSMQKRKCHHQLIFVFTEENGRYGFIEGHLEQKLNGDVAEKLQFNILRSGEYSNAKPFKQALSGQQP